MTDHLPECFATTPIEQRTPSVCICDRLRACEHRVRDEFADHARDMDYSAEDRYRRGRADGVQAARDAVEAVGHQHPKWVLISTHYEGCWKHHSECALTLALAAIDALRGEPND